MNYLDFQLLLYVPQERYEACRAFYEQVFAVQPFYGWDEGPEDRGVKYDLAGAKLVLLTQEDPFPTYGAVHFQLEVPSLEDIFRRARAAGAVTQEPFFRPYGWHMFRMKDPAGNHINIYTVPQTYSIPAACMAWVRSAMMSSASSRPMLNRKKPS